MGENRLKNVDGDYLFCLINEKMKSKSKRKKNDLKKKFNSHNSFYKSNLSYTVVFY